ncbi:sugar nucleotide-binding protein [Archangium minus]|uniref:Sugar nucleotide-binding protein n=1 Tax=Archangium minus TaxID=83450 RepID=A0ABY9X0Y2_9BACT|nr:sugar nucleotide-binding protein [Archangium minus]
MGVWHLANRGAISWAALVGLAAELANMESELIEARPSYSLRRTARRPRYSVLGSERGGLMPPPALRAETTQCPRRSWTEQSSDSVQRLRGVSGQEEVAPRLAWR